MKCPELSDLPTPSTGLTRWPWTEGSIPPASLADPTGWPKITVITPSFQQGRFLEETIRSVLLQAYPNLEYMIFDGGSTDESVSIIEKYSKWVTYWVSEKDDGQAAVINDGFKRSTGEILAWVNSDDALLPNSLVKVASYFQNQPDWQWLYGRAKIINENSEQMHDAYWVQKWEAKLFLSRDIMVQPAVFWRRSLWQAAGLLETNYNWGFDWEWFIRASYVAEPHYVPDTFALARVTEDTKTMSGGAKRRAEVAAISRRHGGFWQPTNIVWLARRFAEIVSGRLAPLLPRRLQKPFQHRSFSLYRRLTNRYQGRYQE